MYENIKYTNPSLPSNISDHSRDFLNKLLKKSPKERIGSHNGITEIKSHELFNSVDWKMIMSRKMKSPITLDCRLCYYDFREIAVIDLEAENDKEIDDFEYNYTLQGSPKLKQHFSQLPQLNGDDAIPNIERCKTTKHSPVKICLKEAYRVAKEKSLRVVPNMEFPIVKEKARQFSVNNGFLTPKKIVAQKVQPKSDIRITESPRVSRNHKPSKSSKIGIGYKSKSKENNKVIHLKLN